MVKTLEIAISKVAALPEAAQEQLGRELLERIQTLEALRAEIEIGIRELDAGLGEELDIDDLPRQAHEEHATKAYTRRLGAEGPMRPTRVCSNLALRALCPKRPVAQS